MFDEGVVHLFFFRGEFHGGGVVEEVSGFVCLVFVHDIEELLEEWCEVEELSDVAGFEREDDLVGVFFFEESESAEGLGAYFVDAADVGVVLGNAHGESFFFLADGEEDLVEDLYGFLGCLDAFPQGDDRVELHVDDREEFAAEPVDLGDHEGAVVVVVCEPPFDGGEGGEFHVDDARELAVAD